MRIASFVLAGAIGVAAVAAAAVSANAAPTVPPPAITQAGANIVQASWPCRWGFHANRWGYCVPNRYVYYRPRPYWHRYYGGGYYGGGYGPPWAWGSPSDHVANELNRLEAGRPYYGY
jgi:hypothetical protein